MMKRFCKFPVASLVLAIGFSTPALAQDDSERRLIADLVVQVQQLQDEVRSLRGQLEDMQYQYESLKQQQVDQYLDLDGRIDALRAGPAPAAADAGNLAPDEVAIPAAGSETPVASADSDTPSDAAPSGDVPALGRQYDVAEEGPEVREPMDNDATVTGIAAPRVAVADTPPAPLDEKAAYDQAFQALKDLRYADAAEGFGDFLAQYPDSEYADNAQYWLGESYYVTGNYQIALDAFQGLLRNYPDSAKAADGLLKIGYTHFELDQPAEAQAALEEVRARYPGTTVARLAEHRLRQIRLESS